MNIDTAEFRALTDEVAQLREQVDDLCLRFAQVCRAADVLRAFAGPGTVALPARASGALPPVPRHLSVVRGMS